MVQPVSIRTIKTSQTSVIIKEVTICQPSGIFLRQDMARVHVMGLEAVKRLVARASLQATTDNHILTASDMFLNGLINTSMA